MSPPRVLRPAPAAAPRKASCARFGRSSRARSTPAHWPVLRAEALAGTSVGPVDRKPHSLEDLLELLPYPFQLGDPIRHGVKLRLNQRAKPRAERGVCATVECSHQSLELLKRAPQGAGSTGD